MNKGDIKFYLAAATFYGLLGWSLVFPTVKNVAYRGFQISRAPIHADYTSAEGRTWTLEHPYSRLGVLYKGGAFDRDGDGNYDEVIEIGTIA